MLNVFMKDPEKGKRYRKSFIKDEATNDKISFNYYLMDRSDITSISVLKNIEMEEKNLILRTTSSYPFTTKTKIYYDGKQYSVDSIYTEEQETSNGMFVRNVKPIKYIKIKR